MPTTLLIVEQPITGPDLEYILELHAGNGEADLSPENYVVVVPVGKESGKVLAVLDDIALADFEGAAEDSHDEPESQAVTEARAVVDATVAAFKAAGRDATGELLTGKVIDGLKNVATRHAADEIIVLTLPHLVEEFLHRDLATRLRKQTDLPTLRLMAHVPLH